MLDYIFGIFVYYTFMFLAYFADDAVDRVKTKFAIFVISMALLISKFKELDKIIIALILIGITALGYHVLYYVMYRVNECKKGNEELEDKA